MSVFFKHGNIVSFGGKTAMQDGTATPQKSPLAIDTTGVTLAIPTNAIAVNMTTLQQSIHVAVDSGYANGYALLPAGQTHRMACADGQPLYIRTESGADSLTFWFEIA